MDRNIMCGCVCVYSILEGSNEDNIWRDAYHLRQMNFNCLASLAAGRESFSAAGVTRQIWVVRPFIK